MPFRITPGDADIATASGEPLRKTRIATILGTRATSAGEVGELEWDPSRGSKLDALRNAANSDAVAEYAAIYVQQALLQALPDEVLTAIDVVVDERTIELRTETALAPDGGASARRTLPVTTTIRR